MQATNDVSRIPLHVYGAKGALGEWIISHFPEHLSYFEPFMGGCSVILRKPKCILETINDRDSRLVNFFKVLRTWPKDLIESLELTPWSRQEFVESLEMTGEAIEDARRMFVMSWMSFGGQTNIKSIYKFRIVHEGTPISATWMYIVDGLNKVASRLRDVQIENRDAFDIIPDYNNPDCLIYADPPYIHDERAIPDLYKFEMSNEDHIKLSGLLKAHSGYVVLSGYPCDLYTELYEKEGWTREDKEANTTGHSSRVESLWLSPRTVDALNKPKQQALL